MTTIDELAEIIWTDIVQRKPNIKCARHRKAEKTGTVYVGQEPVWAKLNSELLKQYWPQVKPCTAWAHIQIWMEKQRLVNSDMTFTPRGNRWLEELKAVEVANVD